MDIVQFLKVIKESPQLSGIFVISIQSSEFSSFFISRLHTYIKSFSPVTSLEVTASSFEELRRTCEMSFLGMRAFYWLKDFHLLDTGTKRIWLEYLKKYQGPHTLLFFDTAYTVPTSDRVYGIVLPSTVTKELYKELYALFFDAQCDPEFVYKLLEKKETLSWDEACMLMGYQIALGRKPEAFFTEWLPKIVVPEKSLFTLSQYFFAQQPKEFFTLWRKCAQDYPEEFWVSYWSEQVWQAALFVTRTQKEGIQEAKKLAYRLPFSFMNKDWKRYTFKQLADIHYILYLFDHTLKNGGPGYGLELWYAQFLR
jgi:hypothetical protein